MFVKDDNRKDISKQVSESTAKRFDVFNERQKFTLNKDAVLALLQCKFYEYEIVESK